MHEYAYSPQSKGRRFSNHRPMNPGMFKPSEIAGLGKQWLFNSAQTEPGNSYSPPALEPSAFATTVASTTSVRWLGHSSVIIEIDGLRLLCDPVWSRTAYSVPWLGPKRYFDPLLEVHDLPEFDAILISHDHYDHLDQQLMRWFARHKSCPVLCPLGVGKRLAKWGMPANRIYEFDWWQEHSINGTRIACTPSRHMSGRGVHDQHSTLWCSWAIIGQQERIFFGADSGLFESFEEIGDKYGGFDLTMLDTGQYGELWPDVHMGPEQAMIAHKALRGRTLLPIHWAGFTLSIHSWTEPAERVRLAAQQDRVALVQPQPGEAVVINDLQHSLDQPEPWWPSIDWRTADQAPIVSTHVDPAWKLRMVSR